MLPSLASAQPFHRRRPASRRRWGGLVRVWLGVALLAAVGLGVSRPASAQPVEEKKRWTARKLGGEGMDLFDAGEFGAALKKFQTADELVPAVTLKVRVARCMNKLDRMLDAAAKYREAIELPLDRRAPQVQIDARKDAVKELAELNEELPTIEIVVQGVGADAATIELDGNPLLAAQLGKKVQVDPGSHSVKARRETDGVTAQQTVILLRHKAEHVTLELPLVPSPQQPGAADPHTGDGWRLGGWVTTGVSGAVLLAGGIVGIVVLTKNKSLAAECPDRQCPADVAAEVHSFDTLRTVSSVGLISGGVGLGAGVLMLLLAPSAGPSVEPGAAAPGADQPPEPKVEVSTCSFTLGACLRGSF
jgi:hypothetical protein